MRENKVSNPQKEFGEQQLQAYMTKHSLTRQQAVSVLDDAKGFDVFCRWINSAAYLREIINEWYTESVRLILPGDKVDVTFLLGDQLLSCEVVSKPDKPGDSWVFAKGSSVRCETSVRMIRLANERKQT